MTVRLLSFCRGDSDRYPGAFQRRSFNNEDIMVTLPDGVDACDIGTITVWCQPFRAIFTRLEIPRKTFVSIVENGRIPLFMISSFPCSSTMGLIPVLLP